jgi:preprotein translocase SecF subunit
VLPIIAALLTIVGYSLNDTIVNFDRVRENLDLQVGRFDLVALVNRSINECLSRTILTSVTTFIAVTMILIFGGGLIRSFAIAMAIGIVIGTYSSIFIANPLMIWMSQYLEARKEAK